LTGVGLLLCSRFLQVEYIGDGRTKVSSLHHLI